MDPQRAVIFDDYVVLPALDEFDYSANAAANEDALDISRDEEVVLPQSGDFVFEYSASSDCYFPAQAGDAFVSENEHGSRNALDTKHARISTVSRAPDGQVLCDPTGTYRCPEYDESSDCYSPIEAIEAMEAFNGPGHLSDGEAPVELDSRLFVERLIKDHHPGAWLLQPSSSEVGAEQCTIRSSYVHVNEQSADSQLPMPSTHRRSEAKPTLCRVLLHHDDMNSRQHVMDALRSVIKSMTRVDAAYVVQEANASGSSLVCVCNHRDAEQYVSGLKASGLVASLDFRLDTFPDTQQMPLYRVLLHTDRNDMRHMLYILSVLRRVMHGLPEAVANEVIQEVACEGSGLVCICCKEQAEKFVAGLQEYGLIATTQCQSGDHDHLFSKTHIEAARFGSSLISFSKDRCLQSVVP